MLLFVNDFSSYGSSSGDIQSMLSGLGGGLNHDHELVRHVQQNAGIQDPETARQCTQQGVDPFNSLILQARSSLNISPNL